MTDARERGAHRHRVELRYQRLAQARAQRPVAAVSARFAEIDGGNLGGLISIELFTTVIPLIIIGFSYFSGFADNVSPGSLFSRELGLQPPLSDRFREAFGTSSGLQSSWTFIGVAGFLVWGIPMSITIAGMFAKAWRRQQFDRLERLWRGATWFLLYLITVGLRERINYVGGQNSLVLGATLFLVDPGQADGGRPAGLGRGPVRAGHHRDDR